MFPPHTRSHGRHCAGTALGAIILVAQQPVSAPGTEFQGNDLGGGGCRNTRFTVGRKRGSLIFRGGLDPRSIGHPCISVSDRIIRIPHFIEFRVCGRPRHVRGFVGIICTVANNGLIEFKVPILAPVRGPIFRSIPVNVNVRHGTRLPFPSSIVPQYIPRRPVFTRGTSGKHVAILAFVISRDPVRRDKLPVFAFVGTRLVRFGHGT